jgi:hypothetical protein
VAEIESEKATLEVEAFASGLLRKVYVVEGATVPVGEVLAVIGAADEAIPERPGRSGVSGAGAQAVPSHPAETAKAPAQEPSEERVMATPVARHLAEERGVDLRQVKGTGPGGRIGKEDVEAYLAQAPAPPPTALAPAAPQVAPLSGIFIPAGLTPMRQAIARRMSLSKPGAPHYYITVEADMTAAMELRRELNAELRKEEDRISVNDMIIRASVLALRKHMEFNVSVLPEGIQPHERGSHHRESKESERGGQVRFRRESGPVVHQRPPLYLQGEHPANKDSSLRLFRGAARPPSWRSPVSAATWRSERARAASGPKNTPGAPSPSPTWGCTMSTDSWPSSPHPTLRP